MKGRHPRLSVNAGFAEMFYINQPEVQFLQYALINPSYMEQCK